MAVRIAGPGEVPHEIGRRDDLLCAGLQVAQLDLAIGLPLRNTQALTNFLEALYDPSSPNLRNYLTPEQFTAQFGPTEQDYQAVIAFAQAQGFTVTATHPNRMLLGVRATVAGVERAFGVTLRL